MAESLRCLEDGHYLILETRGDDPYYVQFAASGEQGMRAEAVSNRFLSGWRRLDATAEGRLRRLGWRPPTDIGDGPVNWWRSYDAPIPADQIAGLAVDTLRKAFDRTRPNSVVYKAFSRSGESILLPTLRLDRHPDHGEPSLRERVDAVMRGILEAEEIIHDGDGDIPVRSGEVMVYVSVYTDPSYVRVASTILLDVAPSPALLAAVNDINAGIRLARVCVTDSGVVVSAEVDDNADLESTLLHSFNAVCSLANDCVADLHSRFGGRTWFEDPPADGGASEPHLGLYL